MVGDLTQLCILLFSGMHYPSIMSAIGQHCAEKERTLVYSVISAGSHGGTLFTGLVGSVILQKYGWQAVFHFIGDYDISSDYINTPTSYYLLQHNCNICHFI